jgi:hypothetical protein
VISDALALIDALESVIGRLDVEVRQHARSDPRVKVLTQRPLHTISTPSARGLYPAAA